MGVNLFQAKTVKMQIWVLKRVNPDPCIFGQLTKFYYLCIVNRNDGIGAQGNKNLLSGLAKFSACPERKKGSREWRRSE